MKKGQNTVLVKELTKKGISQRNAYRIINESKGTAAVQLGDALRELIEAREEIARLKAILKSRL